MKYNILGFEQEQMVRYGLDVVDAIILRWFIDFAGTNKMKKAIDKETNDIYYLVFYEAIIKEFPALGISSTKAIANRFDKYIAKGLLKKKIKKGGGASGTQTLFCITSLVGDMIYSPEKIQELELTIERSDSNSTSFRNSDKNQTSYRKKRQEPNFQSDSEKEVPTRTKLPVATRTELPVALNNHSSNINSSSKFSPQAINLSKPEEEELRKILNNYVDTQSFSEDFIPKLYQRLKNSNILKDQYQDFIDFAYSECNKKVKDKDKLLAYMYSSMTDNYFISLYMNHAKVSVEKETLIETQNIICPICSTKHLKYNDCPCCGLDDYLNEIKIKFYSAIYNLPEFEKQKLNQELNELAQNFSLNLQKGNIFQLKKLKENIYNKYFTFPHEEYVKIFG